MDTWRGRGMDMWRSGLVSNIMQQCLRNFFECMQCIRCSIQFSLGITLACAIYLTKFHLSDKSRITISLWSRVVDNNV